MFFKLNIGNLRSILIKQNLLEEETARAYSDSAEEGAVPLEHWLISNQILTKREIYSALKKEYKISYIDLINHLPNQGILKLLNHSILIETKSFPISLKDNNLNVAMSEPLNIFHLDKIKSSVDYNIIPFFTNPKHIEIKHQELLNENIIEDDFKSLVIKEESNNKDSYTMHSYEDIDGGNLSEILSKLFLSAIKSFASDIHFDPYEMNINVRFRINGNLKDIINIPSELYPKVVSRVKLLSSLNISERRIPQDGGFYIVIEGRELDIRSSFIPTVFGEKMVLRLIDRNTKILSLENLGTSKSEKELIKNILKRRQGLVLVTGPTGSGKTTTLYSILDELNSKDINIITIEDPVEMKIDGLNQIQVNSSIGLDFKTVLRHVLRQDPDIIMVGEIRDLETAKMAVSSAITGHMVLSTLHTEDGASAVMRLLDMGIEEHLILSSVRAVISQRLYRENCKSCLEEESVDEDYSKYLAENNIEKTYRSKGCSDCNYTGCIGREPIFEVLEFNDRVVDVFRENVSITEIRKNLKLINHKMLDTKMKDKVNEGKADLKEYIKLFGI